MNALPTSSRGRSGRTVPVHHHIELHRRQTGSVGPVRPTDERSQGEHLHRGESSWQQTCHTLPPPPLSREGSMHRLTVTHPRHVKALRPFDANGNTGSNRLSDSIGGRRILVTRDASASLRALRALDTESSAHAEAYEVQGSGTVFSKVVGNFGANRHCDYPGADNHQGVLQYANGTKRTRSTEGSLTAPGSRSQAPGQVMYPLMPRSSRTKDQTDWVAGATHLHLVFAETVRRATSVGSSASTSVFHGGRSSCIEDRADFEAFGKRRHPAREGASESATDSASRGLSVTRPQSQQRAVPEPHHLTHRVRPCDLLDISTSTPLNDSNERNQR